MHPQDSENLAQRGKMYLFLLIYWMITYTGGLIVARPHSLDFPTFLAFAILLPIMVPLMATMWAIAFPLYYGIKFVMYLIGDL